MPRIFAHRGSSDQYAENTRAAFMQAVRDGADGLECDIHLSTDGTTVAHHDAILGRTSNGAGPLAQHSWDELSALDFSSWKTRRWPSEYGTRANQLVTLEDILDIAESAGRPIDVAIELKHATEGDLRVDHTVLEILRDRGATHTALTSDGEAAGPPAGPMPTQASGATSATASCPAPTTTFGYGNIRISLMSFEADSARHVAQEVGAEHVCMLLENKRRTPTEASKQDAAMHALDTFATHMSGPGVSYIRAHENQVRRWVAAGLRHRIWTVDTWRNARYVLDLGATELTTNVPAQLREMLVSQGRM